MLLKKSRSDFSRPTSRSAGGRGWWRNSCCASRASGTDEVMSNVWRGKAGPRSFLDFRPLRQRVDSSRGDIAIRRLKRGPAWHRVLKKLVRHIRTEKETSNCLPRRGEARRERPFTFPCYRGLTQSAATGWSFIQGKFLVGRSRKRGHPTRERVRRIKKPCLAKIDVWKGATRLSSRTKADKEGKTERQIETRHRERLLRP